MVEETAASTETQIVETETQSETETETETEATTVPVIEERSTVDGKMQSYLTGEWKDEEVVTRRPIAVMIPIIPRRCLSTDLPQVLFTKRLWKEEYQADGDI